MLGKAVVLRNSLSRRFAALGSSFFFSSEIVQNNSDVIAEEGNNRTWKTSCCEGLRPKTVIKIFLGVGKFIKRIDMVSKSNRVAPSPTVRSPYDPPPHLATSKHACLSYLSSLYVFDYSFLYFYFFPFRHQPFLFSFQQFLQSFYQVHHQCLLTSEICIDKIYTHVQLIDRTLVHRYSKSKQALRLDNFNTPANLPFGLQQNLLSMFLDWSWASVGHAATVGHW